MRTPQYGDPRYDAWLRDHDRRWVEISEAHPAPGQEYDAAMAEFAASITANDDFFIEKANRAVMPPPGVYEWNLDAVRRANMRIIDEDNTVLGKTTEVMFRRRWGTSMRGKLLCVLARFPDGAYVIFTHNMNVRVNEAFVRRWSAVTDSPLVRRFSVHPDSHFTPEHILLRVEGGHPAGHNFKHRVDYYADVRDSSASIDSDLLDNFREWAAGRDITHPPVAWNPLAAQTMKDFGGLRTQFLRWYNRKRRHTLAQALALTDFRPRPNPPTEGWPARPRLMALPGMEDVPLQLIMEHAATRATFGGVAPARFLTTSKGQSAITPFFVYYPSLFPPPPLTAPCTTRRAARF